VNNPADVVVAALTAARESNVASIRAIDAVLAIITPAEKPVETTEEVVEGDCTHENAPKISTGAGVFRVCECGYQEQIVS
jgi:hypothetical protein